jgi:Domain of unknown function (DUF397)
MSSKPKWRKSSRSNNQSACVELSVTSTRAGIRDSKNPEGGALIINHAQLTTFLERIRRGQHDL